MTSEIDRIINQSPEWGNYETRSADSQSGDAQSLAVSGIQGDGKADPSEQLMTLRALAVSDNKTKLMAIGVIAVVIVAVSYLVTRG